MIQLVFKPTVHKYDSCKAFAEAFKLGDRDLVLSNEYIYNPYFGDMKLPAKTIFQEKFGIGEPTDVMVEAIMAEAAKMKYQGIVAIGGGTVIEIA